MKNLALTAIIGRPAEFQVRRTLATRATLGTTRRNHLRLPRFVTEHSPGVRVRSIPITRYRDRFGRMVAACSR